MKNPYRYIQSIRSRFYVGLFSLFALSCDFQNTMGFEMPTWFLDLQFPLVQKKYSLGGMVNDEQIFSTPDSIGMQLVLEGILPDTTIGSDILEVELNQKIEYIQPATNSPNFSFSFLFIISFPISSLKFSSSCIILFNSLSSVLCIIFRSIFSSVFLSLATSIFDTQNTILTRGVKQI